MRPQCKRIYSALPSLCDRICNGLCETPCVSDASPESRVQSPESSSGEGLLTQRIQNYGYSPSPNPSGCACARDCSCLEAKTPAPPQRSDWTTQREVMHHLTAGLRAISNNDFGHPWPNPHRITVARLVAEFDADLCVYAANEARQIVVSQDRAPNITGLFEKKLRDLAAEAEHRAEVRQAVRDSLGVAA